MCGPRHFRANGIGVSLLAQATSRQEAARLWMVSDSIRPGIIAAAGLT